MLNECRHILDPEHEDEVNSPDEELEWERKRELERVKKCPCCEGSGIDWDETCAACGGSGIDEWSET